jgi:hypothetical protein
LSNLTQIDGGFLSGCRGLTNINLSGLSNVIQIESGFLFGCRNLTNIDLTPLSNIAKIKRDFLSRCNNLTKIKIIPPQKTIIIRKNMDLESKLEFDLNWYNTEGGKKWARATIRKSNNIKNSKLLLDNIDYL